MSLPVHVVAVKRMRWGRPAFIFAVVAGCTGPNPAFRARAISTRDAGPSDSSPALDEGQVDVMQAVDAAPPDVAPASDAASIDTGAGPMDVAAVAEAKPDVLNEAGGGSFVSVDDRTTGTGSLQFHYTPAADWTWCNPCEPGALLYKDSNTWSSTSGAAATLAFNGTRVRLYGVLDPVHGIGAVSIDGGAETLIDFYVAKRIGNQLVWTSDVLALGDHVLKVRVTNTRNPASTDTAVAIDRVDVE